MAVLQTVTNEHAPVDVSPETYKRDFLGKDKRGEGRFDRDRDRARDVERVEA